MVGAMRTCRFTAVALLALLAPVAACDLASKATADKVMIATLLGTPAIDLTPVAAKLDAGTLPDGGSYTLPGQTRAYVFFGTRQGTSLDKAPTPISDATVTVGPPGGASVALTNDGNGSYSQTSIQDSHLSYQGGS